MVCTRGGFRDPYDGKRGLDDLLNNYGSEDLCARCAIARRDLCGVMNTMGKEPGGIGEVEDLEEACCERRGWLGASQIGRAGGRARMSSRMGGSGRAGGAL